MKSLKLPLLGLTLVTPAFGASHALATPSDGPLARWSDSAAQVRLKAGLLSIDPRTKLDIAGDRVQLMQLSANTAGQTKSLLARPHTTVQQNDNIAISQRC